MKVAGQELMADDAGRNFRTIRGLDLAMEHGRTSMRIFRLLLSPALMLAAAFVVASWQVGLAQGDADLEAPGSAPFATPASPQPTLFQNVRIFDGRSAALSAPSNVLVRGNTIARISLGPIPVEPNAGFAADNGRGPSRGFTTALGLALWAPAPRMLLK